jgi:phosphoenolpyruvate carboxykinase (GTP)
VGVVRRDPMAMRPFCGYNMADYFAHWLRMGEGRKRFPKIFYVNWFRRNAEGKYLWPGFGENLRVLRWIIGRVSGTAAGRETPIGILPPDGTIDTGGLEVSAAAMKELFHIDRDAWIQESEEREAFLAEFGDRMPEALRRQNRELRRRIGA